MIKYDIISTGSVGNAVVIEDRILIDCGVSYKDIAPYVKSLRLVLLTHRHGDHFRESTLQRLAKERPSLRFAAGKWLIRDLIGLGVNPQRIDWLKPNVSLNYSSVFPASGNHRVSVTPVPLSHDVPNFGFKVILPGGKLFYATDTGNLNGISAPGYDLYMVEANYVTEEIMQKIAEKEAAGEFPYEKRSLKYHLSKEKADNFIYSNIGRSGEYVYMHTHIDAVEPENTEN